MRKLKYLSICLLSALALTACEDDPTVINPDPGNNQQPTDPGSIESVCRLEGNYNSGNSIAHVTYYKQDLNSTVINDRVKVVLPVPRTEDLTVRVGLEPDFANKVVMPNGGNYAGNVALEFRKLTHLWVDEPMHTDALQLNGAMEAYVTVKAGETESEPIAIVFDRSKIDATTATVFPVRVTDAVSGELYVEVIYVIDPIKQDPEVRGDKNAVFVGYVDTETMSPLIANKLIYNLVKDNYNTGETTEIYNGPMFDIVCVRTAFIKKVNGAVKLDYTADMQYILKNNYKYLKPLQENGQKVCLVIKGGATELGFSNMTDAQISDFVMQVKATMDVYDLDGVNLWDEGAGYDKEGAAPVNAESYAKLIKAIKTAMPDKLLTLVDTRETTEALCNPVDGISVGNYLDYAWSSLGDFIAPYEPNAMSRALAGMPEERYGTLFHRDPEMMSEDELLGLESHPVIGGLMSMMQYTPLSGTNVLAIYDIPYRDYGKEGVWQSLGMLYEACRYPAPEDFSEFVYGMVSETESMRDYYAFKKDW